MRGTLFIAAFVATALTGCATGMGGMGGMGGFGKTNESRSQFRVSNVFSALTPVTLAMSADIQTFGDNKGLPTEIFARLKPGPLGTDQHKANLAVMEQIGMLASQNRFYETYIYVPLTDFRSPEMLDYIATIENKAGKNRAFIKADARMTGAENALLWTRDARVRTSDALISADEHGLVAKTQ